MEENLSNKTKKFILDFFKESKVTEKNGVVMIEDVPNEFEEFLGKKGPYKLVFDYESHNRIDDSELIAKGSYFLLAIRDYMRNKGQTTLLKANVKIGKVDLKKQLKIKGKIANISEKKKIGFISRFTFISTCQYLNKKRQFKNEIIVKDKESIDVKLPGLQKGKKEDLSSANVSEQYKTAKNVLGKLIDKETYDTRELLKEKLEKELSRIKEYYYNQKQEKDDEVGQIEEKIRLLESKLRHTFYERDIIILRRIIRESNEKLVKLENTGYEERLKKEEKFHINDELNKHALIINNELINCSVIYYPIITYSVEMKGVNKKSGKIIEAGYDSILKKFYKP